MKCTDKELTRHQRRELMQRRRKRKVMLFIFLLALLLALVIFLVYYFILRSHELVLEKPYQMESSAYGVLSQEESGHRASPFTENLCVSAGDVSFEDVSVSSAEAGAIMDLGRKEVLYAKNMYETLYPASLTKIMTALVALKYGNLDDVILIDEYALDIDPESSICYLEYGDQYTLKQLIYGLLIASGNDAGNAIAYHIGGSVEGFVELMNEEAWRLGATGTHFSNAHGLQDENHYTTAYDLYLIFQEAMKYSIFSDAISQSSYTVTYTAADEEQYERTWTSTSYYFTGEADAPSDVTVFGGKTGTTDEAGACLALLSKDPYGNSYFSIIMKSDNKEDLYREMNDLLSIINKKQL